MSVIEKVKRRARCELQGCKKAAFIGIGKKGNDLFLCEDHFKELVKEGTSILDAEITRKRVEGAKATREAKAEAKKEAIANGTYVEEPKVEKPVKPKEEYEEVPNPTSETGEPIAYFECKYCHQKFSRLDMTPQEFAKHSKQCKKEHEK